jgi:hypothetical protein
MSTWPALASSAVHRLLEAEERLAKREPRRNA